MLMLINPMDEFGANKDTYMPGRELDRWIEYYVLDTDDLVVETVSYNDLYKHIENGVAISNVVIIDGVLTLRGGTDCVKLLELERSLLGGVVQIRDKGIEINKNFHALWIETFTRTSQGGAVLGSCLRINGKRMCKWVSDAEFIGSYIPYLFKVGEYLIVKYFVTYMRLEWCRMFTLIFDMSGQLIDIITQGNIFDIEYGSLDPVFTSKFLSLMRGKY